jgi:hypothetical protein
VLSQQAYGYVPTPGRTGRIIGITCILAALVRRPRLPLARAAAEARHVAARALHTPFLAAAGAARRGDSGWSA